MDRILAENYNATPPKHLIRQATVLDFDSERNRARIYLDDFSGIQEIHARTALPYNIELAGGDRVLVAGEEERDLYIIGVLSTHSTPPRIRAQNGSSAVLQESDGRQKFQIYADDGQLVLEYDPEKHKTTIRTAPGDLELQTAGNLSFAASKNISFTAENINLTGKESFTATAGEPESRHTPSSSVSLGKYRGRFSSPDLQITTARTTLFADEFKIAGKKVFASLAKAVINADKLETRAHSIVSRARNLYQNVEKLAQLKSGRLKMIIQSTCHCKSKNAIFKAEEDFKIKAERINLG